MADSKIISGLNIGGDEATIYNFRSGYSFYGEADGDKNALTTKILTDTGGGGGSLGRFI